MATIREHLSQREHNLALISFLQKAESGFLDWQVTAYFYATLHQVHATLHALGTNDQELNNHKAVQQKVLENISSADVDYSLLLALSYRARYTPDYPITEKERNKAEHYFNSIDKECRSCISTSIKQMLS